MIESLAARFDHVGLAVPRIVDALPLYRDLLGGEFLTGGDNRPLGFRGVQLTHPQGKVEILEPLRGSEFFRSFFAKRPQGGLHHLTYVVDDLADAVLTVERSGYTVHKPEAALEWWHEVFIDLGQTHGVLVQLAQTSRGYDEGPRSLDEVLAGHGNDGNGEPSPGQGDR